MAVQLRLVEGIQKLLQSDPYFQVLPFEWNDTAKTFNVRGTYFWRRFGLLLCCIFAPLTLAECLRADSMYDNVSEKFMAASTVSALIWSGCMYHVVDSEFKMITAVLNEFIKLENEMDLLAPSLNNKFRLNPTDFKAQIVGLLNKVLVLSVSCLRVLVSTAAVIDPSFPTNVVIRLHSLLSGRGVVLSAICKVISLLVNLVFWHLTMTLAIVFFLQILVNVACTNGFQLSFLR